VGELAAFLGIAILVIVTPGQDTALTIRNTLFGGRPAGVATAAGVAAGQACWTVAASVGLAALLVASEPVFVALKLAGAAYLVYLGFHALCHAIRPVTQAAERTTDSPLAPRRAFRQGLLSNLGNPKMAVFFTSLLPQFGSSFWSLLALGLLFCSLTLAWLSAYSFGVARAGDLLRRRRVRRTLDALTGTVLVAFGIRLAAER
jgi:threonine/homoserine/homoserine lactone efflux protein